MTTSPSLHSAACATGNRFAELPPRVFLWGGTGQAKVVRPIVEYFGSRVVAVFDDTPGLAPPFSDVPLHCGRDAFLRWIEPQRRDDLGFVVSIGNPHGRVRLELSSYLAGFGVRPATVVHPTAWVDRTAKVGEGSQIMAGALVLAEARVGRHCIVNTKASVDHECVLADGVELAPGATLCGLVNCGVNAWICAGATILPRIRIGADAIVGAGGLVRQDVNDSEVVVGLPARLLKTR